MISNTTIHSKHTHTLSKLTEQVASVGTDCLDMRHSNARTALELVLLLPSANFSAMLVGHPQQIVRRLADFALLCGEAVLRSATTQQTLD